MKQEMENTAATPWLANINPRLWAFVSQNRVILILLALIAIAPFVLEEYRLSTVTRSMIYGIAACAVGFIFRYGGMVSFGHSMFFGIGAYWVLVAQRIGLNEALIVWPLAAALAGSLALLIAAISLRTKGVSFFMVTIGFAQVVFYILSSIQYLGAADGAALFRRNTLAGASIENSVVFHLVALAALVAVLYALKRLAVSPFGLALNGISQNERHIAALGYNTRSLKLWAFAISGSITGLAGALAGNYYLFVSPFLLHWSVSGEFLVMMTLGGVGSVFGGLVGSLALLQTIQWLSLWTTYWGVFLGPLIIILVLYAPSGLVQALDSIGRRPK